MRRRNRVRSRNMILEHRIRGDRVYSHLLGEIVSLYEFNGWIHHVCTTSNRVKSMYLYVGILDELKFARLSWRIIPTSS
jgi:hypothetical protein